MVTGVASNFGRRTEHEAQHRLRFTSKSMMHFQHCSGFNGNLCKPQTSRILDGRPSLVQHDGYSFCFREKLSRCQNNTSWCLLKTNALVTPSLKQFMRVESHCLAIFARPLFDISHTEASSEREKDRAGVGNGNKYLSEQQRRVIPTVRQATQPREFRESKLSPEGD